MKILQWLFKVTREEQAKEITPTNKETRVKEVESKDLFRFKRGGVHRTLKISEEGDSKHKESNSITILIGRNNARAWFYSNLDLKRLGSFRKRQHCQHSVRIRDEELGRGVLMGHKADSPAHVGNKVLPICDSTITTSTIVTNDQNGSLGKKDKIKGDKTRAISRMKDLWKWAATAKSEKGGKYIGRKVMYFRNRGALKAAAAPHDNDDESSSSPKISFKWETCSCSTSSSAYSAFSATSLKHDRKWIKPSTISIVEDLSGSDQSANDTTLVVQDKDQCNPRTGNWITTDSEFVVLEL